MMLRRQHWPMQLLVPRWDYVFRAAMQPGDTVLINGATGFTGRVAVQIARHYGAKKVIATGRNPESLQALLDLGADDIYIGSAGGYRLCRSDSGTSQQYPY